MTNSAEAAIDTELRWLCKSNERGALAVYFLPLLETR